MAGIPRVEAGETLGVEEEYLLVEPATALPVPVGPDVVATAATWDVPWQAQYEYAASQVEVATGVCSAAGDAARQLADARARLAGPAAERGAVLVAVGGPIVTAPVHVVTPNPRYARLQRHYGAVYHGYMWSGLHVHVGVPDRDAAARVLGHVTPWLPALLALSANSPLRDGAPAGSASTRAVAQAALPGAGPPPAAASSAAYDRHLATMVDSGAFADDRLTFWQARLSPHLPTVEIRAADSVPSPADARLLAALCRALVVTAAAEVAAGRPAPECAFWQVAQWTAARHGLRGPALDPVTGRACHAWDRVDALLALLSPALAAAGELAHSVAALSRLRRRGNGADRQLAAAVDGPAAVVRTLTRLSATTDEPAPV